MHLRIINWFKATYTDVYYQSLQRTWLGRAINAISFMMVMALLALWVALFTILRDDLSAGNIPRATISAISCFAFFGGLVLAIILGGWLGNALRRIFWKILIKLGR
jgi:hypothetical protein